MHLAGMVGMRGVLAAYTFHLRFDTSSANLPTKQGMESPV